MTRSDITAHALSQISDAGLFEALATAVLREANPALYSNLTHPGLNARGKTKKAPVDGLAFVLEANPRHMVAVHHTTCLERDLRRKWLHDPSTPGGQRGKRRSSAPLGDLLKTIAIARLERVTCPTLRVTLALTTNGEPPEDITREVTRAAATDAIELDIWSRSRLAQFLDQDPRGQRLRKQYLGIDQEQLSPELLSELSRRSLATHAPAALTHELIDRQGVQRAIKHAAWPVAFLVGASGVGKSVACFRHLSRHVEQGGYALVIEHEAVAQSASLEQAIDVALRRLYPSLAPGAGMHARKLTSANDPLLLAVEDLSRSGQSALLVEKLARWGRAQATLNDENSWQLLCPLWPELFDLLGDQLRKHVEPLSTHLTGFEPEDARRAILARARTGSTPFSDLDADALAERLGFDPLLIGLWDFGSDVHAVDVLSTFVSGSMQRLAASNGNYTSADYFIALNVLARRMLSRREMNPTWEQVSSWVGKERETLAALRQIIRHGEVVRLSDRADGSRLRFRHDRVRKWLLAEAASRALIDTDLEIDVLADPFFADVLGEAISMPGIRPENIDAVRQQNPLALFYSLQAFGEPSTTAHQAVLTALDGWLSLQSSHSRARQSLRYQALAVLSDTQSSSVPALLTRFRDRSWAAPLAALRNGQLKGGIDLCRSLEPGSGAFWRDRAVAHAMGRFGARLTDELATMLRHPTGLPSGELSGALRMAGHMGSESLSDALKACWDRDEERGTRLQDYLWAATQCGGARTSELLQPICDAWAMLSDVRENEGRLSDRSALAAHHVSWAFWRRLPTQALHFFMRRAEQEDLRWPITYMLHGVDHPDAMTFLVNESAVTAKQVESSGGYSTLAGMVRQHWDRMDREKHSPISMVSRGRLCDLWTNSDNDKYVRQAAFWIWCAVSRHGDIELLQQFQASPELQRDVLPARLSRGDASAVPLLAQHLREQPKDHWWLSSANGIRSAPMLALIDDLLAERGKAPVELDWGDRGDMDWHLSDLLIYLDPTQSEPLLHKHWWHLRYSPRFVQAALYTAGRLMLENVAEVVRECPSPKQLFEHIDMRFGIKHSGHPGVTRLDQVAALAPYLGYLGDMAIYSFWGLCNERGWHAFRREHLDDRLDARWRSKEGLDDATLHEQLNAEVNEDTPVWLDHWVSNLVESGRNAKDILDVVRHWLTQQKSSRALEVAASLVVLVGHRSDIELLQTDDQSELAAHILEDTRYAVYRRTLS